MIPFPAGLTARGGLSSSQARRRPGPQSLPAVPNNYQHVETRVDAGTRSRGQVDDRIRDIDVFFADGVYETPSDQPDNVDAHFTKQWIASRSRKRSVDATPVNRLLSTVFHNLDTEQAGYLDAKELEAALRMIQVNFCKADFLKCLKAAQVGPDQRVTHDQFLRIMFREPMIRASGKRSLEDLPLLATSFGMRRDLARRVFSVLDEDESGTLDFEEIFEGFQRMGFFFSKSEMQDLVAMADATGDGDGHMDAREFLNLLSLIDDLEHQKRIFEASNPEQVMGLDALKHLRMKSDKLGI